MILFDTKKVSSLVHMVSPIALYIYRVESEEMLSHLYLMINEGLLAIPEKYEKLIISLRTAQAIEYSLDKEQTSYDDLLDSLRLIF
ncbi:hypothetical protein BH18THE1_BH18THE1_16240 [soil metagenome]